MQREVVRARQSAFGTRLKRKKAGPASNPRARDTISIRYPIATTTMLCGRKNPFRPEDNMRTLLTQCLVSGEVPEEPVVSKRTGTFPTSFRPLFPLLTTRSAITGIVYEKRLLIAYLAAHANHGPPPEPADDELDPETDLLPLRTARTVRPRPPQLTSLPALLQAFQAEWDALVLEAFETRAQLGRAREELATALYQHDAAVRVIARLTRERDEARDALGRLTVTPARGVGEGEGQGEAMQLDGEVLATRWAEHVDEVHQRFVLLSASLVCHVVTRRSGNC